MWFLDLNSHGSLFITLSKFVGIMRKEWMWGRKGHKSEHYPLRPYIWYPFCHVFVSISKFGEKESVEPLERLPNLAMANYIIYSVIQSSWDFKHLRISGYVNHHKCQLHILTSQQSHGNWNINDKSQRLEFRLTSTTSTTPIQLLHIFVIGLLILILYNVL